MCRNQQGEGAACHGGGGCRAEGRQQFFAFCGSLYYELFYEAGGSGVHVRPVGKLCRCPAGGGAEGRTHGYGGVEGDFCREIRGGAAGNHSFLHRYGV